VCHKPWLPDGGTVVSKASLHIREANSDDAAALTQLYFQLTGDPHVNVLPARLKALLQDPDSFVLVVEIDRIVVATAHLTLCHDVMYAEQPFAVIENVVVSTERRGQGIGALLFAEIERRALNRDCSKLMLLSSQNRQEAHDFFRRCGYSDSSKRGFVKYRRQLLGAAVVDTDVADINQ
jgi:N-acetylglutamate synthase-like GNAT family acetyltransferase